MHKNTIRYLAAKQDSDSLFFHKYDTDDEGKMIRLFWVDSQSIIDYEKFRGFLVFDTYRTARIYAQKDYPIFLY